ncbi:hypothetical protein H2O64_01555 [Kordia sp. YSTF-M3]|uniref:Uncharacterized protein n=1 Tax=Kordia aestuariivivens TaxID=2759037 RepID=A0ABR7Q4M1_9FLAO|nr:DUF6155 family protein [Kordia aestuariivivens]MBC8753336.1 hypothetical protein [Kordia aestuariivivens]
MRLRDLKKELHKMDKSEMIKLISEMYSKIPSAKEFLDVFSGMKIETLIEKYKKEIERYVFPSGREMILRETEARKIIRTVRKMKITELNVELELYYVECCLEIIQDFGYSDENYYISIEKMFDSAIKGISEIGEEEKYQSRINNIYSVASEYGMEFYY